MTQRPPLDPDPRYVPEDPRVPEGWEHRRSKVVQRGYANDLAESTSCLLLTLGLLAVLAIVVAVLVAPRSGPDPTTPPPASGAAGSVRALALVSASTSDPSQSEAPPAAVVTVSGNISWASPSLGSRYLAIRAPRGTLVRICAATCLTLPSTDYGPSKRIRPARIADLALGLWRKICALPASAGLCHGSIEIVGGIGEPAVRPMPTGPATDVAP